MFTALEADLVDWAEQQIDVDRDDGVEEFPMTRRRDERREVGIEPHARVVFSGAAVA